MGSYEVVFYRDKRGRSEVKDFISNMSPSLKRKTLQELCLLEEKGPLVREPFSKSLRDGLFELRINLGGDSIRLLYFFCKDRRILVTSGFAKKSQKTPKREIDKAFRLKSAWDARTT